MRSREKKSSEVFRKARKGKTKKTQKKRDTTKMGRERGHGTHRQKKHREPPKKIRTRSGGGKEWTGGKKSPAKFAAPKDPDTWKGGKEI